MIFLNNTYDKNVCSCELKKNGFYKYKITYLNNFNKYICLINDKIIFLVNNFNFPSFIGINEDEIIKQLLIIKYIQKSNIKYINTKNKFNNILIFKDTIINREVLVNIMSLFYIYKNKEKYPEKYKYFFGNIKKDLCYSFMINKYFTNDTNKNILIGIFYNEYIFTDFIKNELHKKYNKSLFDFDNYNQLYLFLKEKEYVDKYYNYYAPLMIKNYKKIYLKLNDDNDLLKYKNTLLKQIKDFEDLDMFELIDKKVSNNFNKDYIKNKFIELCKKYNI